MQNVLKKFKKLTIKILEKQFQNAKRKLKGMKIYEHLIKRTIFGTFIQVNYYLSNCLYSFNQRNKNINYLMFGSMFSNKRNTFPIG